jgi:hypothetical protein
MSDMTPPTAEELQALRAIVAHDQGQAGDLNIFEARKCEDLGWVEKAGSRYRLTELGRKLLAGQT